MGGRRAQLLPPANYTLWIYSVAQAETLTPSIANTSFIKCNFFELEYVLNTTLDSGDEDLCDQTEVFPTDLYSRTPAPPHRSLVFT